VPPALAKLSAKILVLVLVPAAGPHQVPSQQITILFDGTVDVPFIGRAVESGWECGFELTRVVVLSTRRGSFSFCDANGT